MPTDKKDLAVIEHKNNKCPILHPGELNIEVLHAFETACHNYITNKDIPNNKQAIKVMTALKGYQWKAWVSVNHELKTLSLNDFLAWFKVDFMPSTWEDYVQISLNQMTQKENQTFCDFANKVQNKNSLLLRTDLHLQKAQVYARIKVGMDHALSTCSCASDKSIHKIVLFKD